MPKQIVKLSGIIPAGQTGFGINHGLTRLPNIHILCKGTAATVVKHTTPHDISNAYYSNSGGAPAGIVGLLIALHSAESDRVGVFEGTSGSGDPLNIPHGLTGTPGVVFLSATTNANIAAGAVTANATNITINPTAGSQNYSIFAASLHSSWGTNQWAVLQGTVSAGAVNAAIPHGLIRVPGFVVLGARTGVDVVMGATSANATNVFLNNPGGGPETYELLLIAGHSIIT